jgi:hypothetical protein
MCDYCDCRTRPLIAELGEQHAGITAAIARLRLAQREDRPLGPPAAALVTLLQHHSALEEATLYPELPAVDIPDAPLVAEHDAVDRALGRVAGGHDEDALDDVLDALERHIRTEEYDLFPAAHQLLDDQAWDRIDARHDT